MPLRRRTVKRREPWPNGHLVDVTEFLVRFRDDIAFDASASRDGRRPQSRMRWTEWANGEGGDLWLWLGEDPAIKLELTWAAIAAIRVLIGELPLEGTPADGFFWESYEECR